MLLLFLSLDPSPPKIFNGTQPISLNQIFATQAQSIPSPPYTFQPLCFTLHPAMQLTPTANSFAYDMGIMGK